jgi:hypothetical protein
VTEIGGVTLVIVDTSAAYFEGDDENNNTQAGKHARLLRRLTTVSGAPTVLVACHPTKAASNDSLLPRGGGAFLNEMDGNLACQKHDAIIDVTTQGKFRGAEFEPLTFRLVSLTCPALVDSKGRQIPTVLAEPAGEAVRERVKEEARKDEDSILVVMLKTPGGSIASMATALGWFNTTGKPAKSRVYRAIEKLRAAKLVTKGRGDDSYVLTAAGKEEARKCS